MSRVADWLGLSRGLLWFTGVGLALAAIGEVALWILVTRFFPMDDPVAVLHYSTDIGIDFIGAGDQITVLPQVGLLVLVVNIVLGMAVVRADRRAAILLWSTAPLAIAVLLGAFYFLWRINA